MSMHFHLYQNGQFVKHDAAIYEGQDYSPDYFTTLTDASKPLIIFFDNTRPISNIETYISTLEKTDLTFTNASELAGFTLTDRR